MQEVISLLLTHVWVGQTGVSDQRELENLQLDCAHQHHLLYFKWLPLRLWRPCHACTPCGPLVLMSCSGGGGG